MNKVDPRVMTHQNPTCWSGAQFNAARVWVGLTHEQLAEEAQVGLATVRRVEASSDLSTFRQTTINKIQNTLEDYGVVLSVSDNTLILAEPDFDESDFHEIDEQLELFPRVLGLA